MPDRATQVGPEVLGEIVTALIELPPQSSIKSKSDTEIDLPSTEAVAEKQSAWDKLHEGARWLGALVKKDDYKDE